MALTYHHVDVNALSGGNGSTWALSGVSAAFNEAGFETDLELATADDIYFIKAGTYVLDSAYDASLRDGTAIAPICLIGVKAATTNTGANVVFSDWGTTSDRPHFDSSTYGIILGDFYKIFNISFQGETNNTVLGGTGCVWFNCKFENDYGSSAARYCLAPGTSSSVINCEIISTNCAGINTGQYGKVLFNYFHDMNDATNGRGIVPGNPGNVIAFNIFDNVRHGILSTADAPITVLNNTFYDCNTAGHSLTTDTHVASINNLFSECSTDAIIATTQTNINFFWKNHFYNNGDNYDGVSETDLHMDQATTSGDPLFTAAGSDFSVQAASPVLGTGLGINLGV